MTRWFSMYPRIQSPVASLFTTVRLRYAQTVSFSSITDKNDPTITTTTTTTKVQVTKSTTLADETKPRRRRRRTAFGADSIDAIPSFQEFQQQQAVRVQYRQFLRLVRPLKVSSPELAPQIRREFRNSQAADGDSWNIKRALSEGTRRYKELSAMLGNQTKVIESSKKNPNDNDDSTTNNHPHQQAKSQSAWPWQQASGTFRPKPSRFPSKSPGST